MKPTSILFTILALLAGIAGYLLSKASLTGKVGISLFYKEYGFLKVWWQAALVIVAIYALLLLVQGWLHKRVDRGTANMIHVVLILVAITGLYLTYDDFRNTLTHRVLGERFHLGGYLFWVGWMLISLFYLTRPGFQLHNDTAIE